MLLIIAARLSRLFFLKLSLRGRVFDELFDFGIPLLGIRESKLSSQCSSFPFS